ncbi:hypothetical protein [Hymenobacter crusticola]|nr:hypothetical protein [Hymenobacter crusticola]
MYNWLYGLAILLLITACEARKSVVTQENAVPAVASDQTIIKHSLMAADTTAPFEPLGAQIDSLNGSPIARINGQVYWVETSGKPDLTHRLIDRDSLTIGSDSATVANMDSSGYGYDAIYTFRLVTPDGRARFTTVRHTMDFAPALSRELLVESTPDKPTFLGYLPQFNALIFQLWFVAEGTDWAESALLLLDAVSGKVRYTLFDHSGEDMHNGNALTTNGRVLLTRTAILHADGRRINITREKLRTAAVQLLNDRIALVLYENGNFYGKEFPAPKNNACVMTFDGRVLDSFPLRAAEIDYLDGTDLNYGYLRSTQTHYLFDLERKILYLLPRGQPLKRQTIHLKNLPVFKSPQRSSEVAISLQEGVGPSLRVYVDTINNKLRYQLLENKLQE